MGRFCEMNTDMESRRSKRWLRYCRIGRPFTHASDFADLQTEAQMMESRMCSRVRLRTHSFTRACSYMYDVSRCSTGSGCLGVMWGKGSHRAVLSIRTRLKAFVSALHRFLSNHTHLYAILLRLVGIQNKLINQMIDFSQIVEFPNF